MTEVTLTGQLVCASEAENALVERLLPRHIELTRAEAGCRAFEVSRTDHPLVWQVDERFADAEAFQSHQERVSASAWGRETAHVERRYAISGLD
ncbi:MAG: antibiotic biosynthesis monooxygenase [Microbacterium sp.]